MTDHTQAVLSLIRQHVGPQEAITAKQIIASLRRQGVTVDDRDIRAIVAEADAPICSGNGGYWLCDDPDELGETIGRLRSQAGLMYARASRLEAWQERLRGPVVVEQLSLGFEMRRAS